MNELKEFIESHQIEGSEPFSTYNNVKAAILASTMYGFISIYQSKDKIVFFVNGNITPSYLN